MTHQLMYCIEHGEMVAAEIGEITGWPLHLEIRGDLREPDVEWCEGPFAYSPPPADMTEEMWDQLFSNESDIQDMLDYWKAEDTGAI